MTLRERIEKNFILSVLGLILGAFVAGLGTYRGFHQLTGAQIIPRTARVAGDSERVLAVDRLSHLENSASRLKVLEQELVEAREARDAAESTNELLRQKLEFTVRYLRYAIAQVVWKNATPKSQAEAFAQQELQLAAKMLIDLIHGWWSQQNEFRGELRFLLVRGSRDPTSSRLVFEDGSSWVVPPEIKRAVLER